MVSINIHSAAHPAASPLGSPIAATLRKVLNAAVPVVVMGLVLVAIVAFRFWATFPGIRDVAH